MNSSQKDSNQIDEITYAFYTNICQDPALYHQAMESKDKVNWKVPIEEELNSMFKNNV